MSVYYLASSTPTETFLSIQQFDAPVKELIPTISLESMDGSKVIRLDNTMGWVLMPGALGLEMAPVDVVGRRVPGVHGGIVAQVKVPPREVFLPLYGRGDTGQRSYREMKEQLRSLIDPLSGSFKVVGSTVRGSRELICWYNGGLEGADGADVSGLSWCKVGLRLTAHKPFAQARTERRLEFYTVQNTAPFLGIEGGSDAPFPPSLAHSAVIGESMVIPVNSELPVYPKLDLVGPMSSFAGELVPQDDVFNLGNWKVEIPAGVLAGSTFTLVTDGHETSARMDGTLAYSKVSLASTLRPFYKGLNYFNVIAPGGTDATRIFITWRDLYWSLW